MVRTQIQLTAAQARRLRAIAERDGISFAEAVRRCVDHALSEAGRVPRAELFTRAARWVGAFPDRSGASDLSGRHDAYLEDAFR